MSHLRTFFNDSGRRRRSGFTMLELLTVMVIGGVITAMSFGKVNTIMTSQRLHAATAAVQNDIEAAFALAQRNRAPVRIAWDASKLQLNVTNRAGTTYYRHTTLGSAYGLKSSTISFSKSPLEIYPNGLANDTLYIALSTSISTSIVDTIWVSRAGLVRIK